MLPAKPALVATNVPRRIVWLVIAHVLVGLVTAFVAAFAGTTPTLRAGIFLGIVFSQTSLLGLWGGLGNNLWWTRLIGGVLGVYYLASVLGLGISEFGVEVFLLVVAATSLVAMLLLIVRFFRIAIHRTAVAPAFAAPIQFSIRHLLILTFVVACLASVGKWTQAYLPHSEVLLFLLLLAAMFGGVGVLPVWFILATKQPLLYSIGLVAVGACAGYWIAGTADAGEQAFWTTVTSTQAMAVIVSLLVLRSGGYRLIVCRHVVGRKGSMSSLSRLPSCDGLFSGGSPTWPEW